MKGRLDESATGVKVLAPVKRSGADIMMTMITYFIEQAPGRVRETS